MQGMERRNKERKTDASDLQLIAAIVASKSLWYFLVCSAWETCLLVVEHENQNKHLQMRNLSIIWLLLFALNTQTSKCTLKFSLALFRNIALTRLHHAIWHTPSLFPFLHQIFDNFLSEHCLRLYRMIFLLNFHIHHLHDAQTNYYYIYSAHIILRTDFFMFFVSSCAKFFFISFIRSN